MSNEGTPRIQLATNDLTLRYGSYLAVESLNLSVNEGEIYGFLGRNGAGKTSTIRMIMGISKPDLGTITFAGKTLSRIGNHEKRSIGYVSQEQYFYPWMSCRRIGNFVGGLYPTWDDTEFTRLLAAFDLPPQRRISHLSGGMRVKLALALAISHRPPILILDEPTAGLDPVARREFLDIIRSQAERYQRTTFFSSHLIDEVERVANRVGIIHRGKMQFEGTLQTLRATVRQIAAPQDPLVVDAVRALPLQYLRSGLEDSQTWLLQGLPEVWQEAEKLGVYGESISLEDAFIALASEPVVPV